MAPWADAIYAMDRQWWDVHGAEVQRDFKGARYSVNTIPSRHNVNRLPNPPFKSYGNSGAGAVNLAAEAGAKRIILLGYDCQKTDGQAHWHGNHPRGLGNAGQIERWPAKFKELATDLGNVEIINASRVTALTCFPRQSLEQALANAIL